LLHIYKRLQTGFSFTENKNFSEFITKSTEGIHRFFKAEIQSINKHLLKISAKRFRSYSNALKKDALPQKAEHLDFFAVNSKMRTVKSRETREIRGVGLSPLDEVFLASWICGSCWYICIRNVVLLYQLFSFT
jgi:hypothetical protein